MSAELILRSLQAAFEREGLEFASFLDDDDEASYPTIAEAISATLDSRSFSGNQRIRIADAIFATIREVLYSSIEAERAYLAKLSRTYTLLFTLNTEPRLIEYFQQVTGQLRLYVGADLLVGALSEQYLHKNDQLTRNTLVMASRLGAKLILTEPVLEEVLGNLRAADAEFRNWFEKVEQHITLELAESTPKIMVRAYLLARLDQDLGRRRPGSWQAFVSQFLPHAELHRPSATDHVRRYLQAAFSMHFETTEMLEELVDISQVQALADDLATGGKDERLAYNDALMALAIYGRRRRGREQSRVTEFGYETWWLTRETKILRYTRDLVRENRGARYVMRADFLLNFMTLAPSGEEARKTLGHVFPSLLGMSLSRRMSSDSFHEIMAKVRAAEEMDDARRSAAVADLVDKLKSNLRRQYAFQFGQ